MRVCFQCGSTNKGKAFPRKKVRQRDCCADCAALPIEVQQSRIAERQRAIAAQPSRALPVHDRTRRWQPKPFATAPLFRGLPHAPLRKTT